MKGYKLAIICTKAFWTQTNLALLTDLSQKDFPNYLVLLGRCLQSLEINSRWESCCCCSVTKPRSTLHGPHGLQHARLPCPSLSPEVCSNSCPLSWWCHLTISSSVTPFSCPQSFPALGSFPMSQLFASWPKYWSFNFSISPVLPMNIQGWFP